MNWPAPARVVTRGVRPPLGRTAAATVLALLLGLQPLSTDVYLPALPMLQQAMSAPMAQVQLTMSALILAFGLAQLVWGPVADRLGRRPVLLVGCALYALASLGATWAPGIEALVVWRALQGVALACAVVCARAMLRDLYEPVEGAHVMALALSGLGVIALGGPLLGGWFAATWGWRAPLALVAAVGLGVFAWLWWRLPETLPATHGAATPLSHLMGQWRAMLRHRVFLTWATLVASTYGGLFTLLAGSTFFYMGVLKLPATVYGAVMALGSLCYIAGTFACRRWMAQEGPAGAVRRGAWFTGAAGVAFAAVAMSSQAPWWAVLLPQGVYAFAHGVHQPCGQAGITGPFPQAAGAASALAGLLLALVAFAIGQWLGVALDGDHRALTGGISFWALCTVVCAAWAVPRLSPRAGAHA